MSIMAVFLVVVAGITGWWLSRQRLAALPWLEAGHGLEFPNAQASRLPPAKIGLGLFLAVASCLFALLSSAYLMRSGASVPNLAAGARFLPAPLLWVNTAALAVSSVGMQWACASANRGQREVMLGNLMAAAVAALLFMIGQLLAWRLLVQGGHLLGSTSADDYFYLLTGAHGAHVLGGLAVLGVTLARAVRSPAPAGLSQTIGLCATYWHFLLLVWLFLFGLLMGEVDAVDSFCRSLVS